MLASETAFDLRAVAGPFRCLLIVKFLCGPVRARGVCGVGVWDGAHSRFHGFSGSNGLSGAEGFSENQRYIKTGERRNRCGDGQRREKKKEIDR